MLGAHLPTIRSSTQLPLLFKALQIGPKMAQSVVPNLIPKFHLYGFHEATLIYMVPPWSQEDNLKV